MIENVSDKLDEILDKHLAEEPEKATSSKAEETKSDEAGDVIEETNEVETEPVKEEVKTEPAPQEQKSEQVIEPASEKLEMPISWKKEVRDEISEQWEKLPIGFRKNLIEREHSNNVLSSQNGELRKRVEEHTEAIKPIQGYIAMKSRESGLNPSQYLSNLANFEMRMEVNPDESIINLMDIYKPRDVVGLVRKIMHVNQISPEQLTAEIHNPLASRVISLEAQQREAELKRISQEEYIRTAEQEEIDKVYNDFKFKHPEYSDEQEGILAGYIGVVKAKEPNLDKQGLLERAYSEMTRDRTPNISRVEVEKKVKEEQKSKLEKAKKAASLQSETPSDEKTTKLSFKDTKATKESIDAILEKNFAS